MSHAVKNAIILAKRGKDTSAIMYALLRAKELLEKNFSLDYSQSLYENKTTNEQV